MGVIGFTGFSVKSVDRTSTEVRVSDRVTDLLSSKSYKQFTHLVFYRKIELNKRGT